MRDLTEKQYEAALKRHGIGPRQPLNYRNIGGGYEVAESNGGTTRRSRLAYFIREQGRQEKVRLAVKCLTGS